VQRLRHPEVNMGGSCQSRVFLEPREIRRDRKWPVVEPLML
jgi:hypothetical protein